MKRTTKCDGCHEEKELHFYPHVVDTGYSAYCCVCALRFGYDWIVTKKE